MKLRNGKVLGYKGGKKHSRSSSGFLTKARREIKFLTRTKPNVRPVYKKRRYYSRSSSSEVGKVYDSGDGTTTFSKKVVNHRPSVLANNLKIATNKNIRTYSAVGQIYQSTSGKQIGVALGVANYGPDLRSISQMLVGTGTTGYRTNKYMIRNCTVETMFTNQAADSCRLYIYDLAVRRDVTTSAFSGFDPVGAWNSGLADNASSEADDATLLGVRPIDSPLFNQYYRIIGRKNVVLGAYGHHVHKLFVNSNRVFNYELTRDFAFMKGITYMTLVVAHGMPINDKDTTTLVAAAPVKVDYVTTVRHAFQGLSSNMFYLSLTNGQNTIGTPQIKTDAVTADFTFA